MPNCRNAALAGLTTACLLFLSLAVATRLPSLVEFVLAAAVGGMVLAIVGRRPPTRQTQHPAVTEEVPAQPVQLQVQPVTGIRLPSAFADYSFVFAAHVLWRPSTDGGIGTGHIAVTEIIRRAREITERRDPSQFTLIRPELKAALEVLRSDPRGEVHVKAESVELELPTEDRRRLDELATLRKQADLWDHQRQYQVSKRRYLRTDVLKDPGSAVVWWLAQNEDNPEQVAQSINMLGQLARAANNSDTTPGASAAPRTSADHFDAFLGALDPAPDADQRLMLASQMARHIDGVDPKTAEEMRRRYSEPDDPDTNDYWGYPGADGTPPS
jgi:hypothetical protein